MIHLKILIASIMFMGTLSACVLIKMFLTRMAALKDKSLRMSYFKTYNSDRAIPNEVIQASRHFSNLFEVPVLFYVICLLAIQISVVDFVTSILAVAFCLFRLAHTYIHLGTNNVIHRMYAYAASCGALVFMWMYVVGKFFV